MYELKGSLYCYKSTSSFLMSTNHDACAQLQIVNLPSVTYKSETVGQKYAKHFLARLLIVKVC